MVITEAESAACQILTICTERLAHNAEQRVIGRLKGVHDLAPTRQDHHALLPSWDGLWVPLNNTPAARVPRQLGRASWRGRVGQCVSISAVGVTLKKKKKK